MGQDSAEPIRVLHVDNEPDFSDLTAEFLERENEQFAVDAAERAAAGLDRLAGTDYDCVVSDYEMPGCNGVEFLRTVREEHPELPFILYTGRGSEAVASEAISAGVTDYLQKETGTEQYAVLANRIENAVGRQRTERELELKNRAIEEAPVGITLTDPTQEDNPLVYANEAFLEITGYSREQVDGWNHRQLQGPETRPEPVAELREAIDAGEPTTVELRNYRADGIMFWNRVTVAPLRDDSGEVVNWQIGRASCRERVCLYV